MTVIELPDDDGTAMPNDEVLTAVLLTICAHATTITPCGEMPKTWGHAKDMK